MNSKTYLLLMPLLCLIFLSRVSPAHACSGYPYFGVDDLADADVLVRATVIDTDDRGYNAILRVEEYYKGNGDRLITVLRFPPALSTGALVRGYDTGCLYAGLGDRFQRGSQGYFGLAPNGNGTFTDYIHGTAHFYPVNGKIYYQEGRTEGYAVEFDSDKVISEKDFIAKMLEAGGRKASVLPDTTHIQFYPLMRFLNITTQKGTHYQINPDRSISKLKENGPLAISPDGAHLAFRVDNQTIVFQYIWADYQYEQDTINQDPDRVKRLTVKGQAVNFSADNNLVAVWDTAHLTIYMITNEGRGNNGTDMELHEVTARQFAETKAGSLPKVIWSANGSTLAWQDSGGVWRWNIFDEAEPQQLVKGKDSPQLIDISSYGRFVRLGSWEKWSLIDSRTGKTYSNTISAPNELYLITMNGAVQDQSEPTTERSCTPPLRENCTKDLSNMQVTGTFPYQMELLGIVSCKANSQDCMLASRSWNPAIGPTDYMGGRNYVAFITGFRAVSYDMQYQQPALLVGDYGLYFDFYSADSVEVKDNLPYLDILNLKGKVDSPIVSIEWGQPVFYRSYLLSSLEYRP